MPTDGRAVTAIKINAAAKSRAGMAARRTPSLSNTDKPKKGNGNALAIKIIVVALLAVGGNFVWKKYSAFQASRPAPTPPKKVQVQDFPPEPEVVRVKPKTNAVKKVVQKRRPLTIEEQIAREVAREQVAESGMGRKKFEAPVFDLEEIKKLRAERDARYRQRFADAEAARKAVEEQLAAARKSSTAKALTGFGGVKFGDVVKGVASAWGGILPGDSVEKTGLTYGVYGEPVAKPVGTLEACPLVWVTPKTQRAFRIEFFRDLKLAKKELHDAETAQLVEKMKGALKIDPFELRKSVPDVRGAEYAFPVGETTVRVGEFGDQLKLIVEHEGLRQEAKAEFDAERAAQAADKSDDEILVSTRYPMGDAVSFRGLVSRFREGTPRSFCGVVFGKKPHESETLVNPKNGEKGYFLDYVRAKCPAFKGFSVGKADIDFWRHSVFAVTLYNNEGGAAGIYDEEFFKSVREALERQYLVKPEERKGTSEYPELVFQKGDLEIVFGPDRSGGFRLKATQQALADIAKVEPVERKARYGRKR